MLSMWRCENDELPSSLTRGGVFTCSFIERIHGTSECPGEVNNDCCVCAEGTCVNEVLDKDFLTCEELADVSNTAEGQEQFCAETSLPPPQRHLSKLCSCLRHAEVTQQHQCHLVLHRSTPCKQRGACRRTSHWLRGHSSQTRLTPAHSPNQSMPPAPRWP